VAACRVEPRDEGLDAGFYYDCDEGEGYSDRVPGERTAG
jgi:hypothetical protein